MKITDESDKRNIAALAEMINTIKEENRILKERLVEILDKNPSCYQVLMERLEYFHDCILQEDARIEQLEKTISVFSRSTLTGATAGWMEMHVSKQVAKVAVDIKNLEIEFERYLGEVFLC